jgi:threonine/homoserine/homoserine lactone efflux protein
MPQLVLLGSICVVLNTFVDVLAVLGANRLLTASAKRAQREKIMVKTSGVTMIGLGTYLALAERN